MVCNKSGIESVRLQDYVVVGGFCWMAPAEFCLHFSAPNMFGPETFCVVFRSTQWQKPISSRRSAFCSVTSNVFKNEITCLFLNFCRRRDVNRAQICPERRAEAPLSCKAKGVGRKKKSVKILNENPDEYMFLGPSQTPPWERREELEKLDSFSFIF